MSVSQHDNLFENDSPLPLSKSKKYGKLIELIIIIYRSLLFVRYNYYNQPVVKKEEEKEYIDPVYDKTYK